MVYIETPRLLLRGWKEEDFVPFAEMNRNPSVMEFFLHPLSEEESRSLFDTVRNEFLRCGYGGYAVERKSDGAFVGFTGFHNFAFDVDFARGLEILWRLRRTGLRHCSGEGMSGLCRRETSVFYGSGFHFVAQ